MENFDFSGWATKNGLRCSDGRTIMKDAFKQNDGTKVPLVWNHQHNEPNNVLGHALLKNMDEGVYAYCKFNDSESGAMAKELVKHGDVNQLSIYANQLKQQGGNVLHGAIREVSLVLAGANPGAYIDSIMCHGAESDEAAIIYTGEDIMLTHSEEEAAEEEEVLKHADDEEKTDNNGEGVEKEEINNMAEENKVLEHADAEPKEKTVKDVFDTLTEEQKTVVYALIGQALEDAGVTDEDDEEAENEKENVKHSDEIEGGNNTMYHNVFENENVQEMNVLSHADQQAILELAKKSSVGTLKEAMSIFAADNKNTLAHGIEDISQLFPDWKDVHAGAPELLEDDRSWVAQVMKKVRKSPVSRVRTRQIDARKSVIEADIAAKGYNDREAKKAMSENLKVLMRTTDPQTVYVRDSLHRDDIIDITDFDVVAYQNNVMDKEMREMIALAALVGDGREDTDPDKIHQDHIRAVWHDDELYTIHADVDEAAAKAALQGTDTSAHFGDEYVFTEAFISQALYARENYKGKGRPDLFCTPRTLNKMLLARDLNGRRIYNSADEIAKVLDVENIHTVVQFNGLTRETEDKKVKELLGLFVNMGNYQFGATKGGEITSFEDFDINFNTYQYLKEARLSGALTEIKAAIALEKDVTPAG